MSFYKILNFFRVIENSRFAARDVAHSNVEESLGQRQAEERIRLDAYGSAVGAHWLWPRRCLVGSLQGVGRLTNPELERYLCAKALFTRPTFFTYAFGSLKNVEASMLTVEVMGMNIDCVRLFLYFTGEFYYVSMTLCHSSVVFCCLLLCFCARYCQMYFLHRPAL